MRKTNFSAFDAAILKGLSGWLKVEISFCERDKSDSRSERREYAFLLKRGKVEKKIFLGGEIDEWWEGYVAAYADCEEYAKNLILEGEGIEFSSFDGELTHSTYNGKVEKFLNFMGYQLPNSIIDEILK